MAQWSVTVDTGVASSVLTVVTVTAVAGIVVLEGVVQTWLPSASSVGPVLGGAHWYWVSVCCTWHDSSGGCAVEFGTGVGPLIVPGGQT